MRVLFKIFYRAYCISTRLRGGLQRRLTPLGVGVLICVVVAAIMTPDTDNNVAYQGFTVALSLLLLAGGFSFFFRGRFSGERSLPRFATVGAPLQYTVKIRNLTQKAQIGLTLMEEQTALKPSFQEWLAVQLAEEKRMRSFRFSHRRPHLFRQALLKGVAVPSAGARQEVSFQAELTPLRRGLLRLSGLVLARPDPLGLVRAFCQVPLPQSVLVLPKRYPLPPIPLPGMMKYQQGGVALASHVGQSEDFVALRDYRQGDPVRHIHWRSWARTGQPVVKEFEDEFFVRHALVLDTFSEDPRSEVFEEAVSVAASFACTVVTQESLLDLLFVGPESYCFTAGRGLAHADQILEILASVQACQSHPFRSLEHLVLGHAGVVSGCICVLLGWDQERQDFVRKLKNCGVPVLVLILRERNKGEALDPGPLRDEPHHFHVLESGKVEQGLANLG